MLEKTNPCLTLDLACQQALGMKGAGVEGVEAMDVVVEGWVVDLEVVATRRSPRPVSSSF